MNIERNTGAFAHMFIVYPSKIGISLHMKVFEPHVRDLYRLRAQKINERNNSLTG
jgi:hypothetical protein